MAIKTTLITEPTKREIKIECPACGLFNFVKVNIGELAKGTLVCFACKAKFEWEEVE